MPISAGFNEFWGTHFSLAGKSGHQPQCIRVGPFGSGMDESQSADNERPA